MVQHRNLIMLAAVAFMLISSIASVQAEPPSILVADQNRPKGNTYNESLTIGSTAGAGIPTKSEPTKPEPTKPQGKTYNESLNVVARAVSQAEVKIIKKIEKTVVIGIYFLLITVALQIIGLKPLRSRKAQIYIGIFVLLTAFLLFQTDWFLGFISKLFGL